MTESKNTAIIWVAVSSKAQMGEDKSSLDNQETDGLRWCEQNGFRVLDILRIPGHSRHYLDINDLNRSMLSKGIDGLDKLLRHIKARDFDVLVCRDAERFARTPALMVRIIAEVIDNAKARIYSTQDGWVDETNYLAWSLMAGFKTGADMKRKANGRTQGSLRRLERGLATVRPPFSHTYQYDEHFKPARMVVDESKRPLLDAIRDLLLSGLPWSEFERELFLRGFGRNGKPFSIYTMRRFLLSAAAWGNNSVLSASGDVNAIYGLHVFDPAVPPPDGIRILWNTHEPAWKGEEAEQIKAELVRRTHLRGKARPNKIYRFSLLMVCADCGRAMSYFSPTSSRVYYRCNGLSNTHRKPDHMPICNNRVAIKSATAQAWFESFIRLIAELPDPDVYFSQFYAQTTSDIHKRIRNAEKQLKKAEATAKRLILMQAESPDSAYLHEAVYQETLASIQTIKQQITEMNAQVVTVVAPGRAQAVRRLKQEGPDWLWSLSEREINQFLHNLLGDLVVRVLGNEVHGLSHRLPLKK